MSNLEAESRDDGPIGDVLDLLKWVLLSIRSSFLLFVAALGVTLLVLAFSVADGVVAGMLVVWGVGALLYAAIGFAGLRLIGYN